MSTSSYQETTDKVDTYDSAPLFISARILLFTGRTKNENFNTISALRFCTRSSRRRRSPHDPPIEFYPKGGVCSDLRQLKTAQKAWQLLFAETMGDMGAKRLSSEPNADHFPETDL